MKKAINSIIDMIAMNDSQVSLGQQNSYNEKQNPSSLASDSSPFDLILNGL